MSETERFILKLWSAVKDEHLWECLHIISVLCVDTKGNNIVGQIFNYLSCIYSDYLNALFYVHVSDNIFQNGWHVLYWSTSMGIFKRSCFACFILVLAGLEKDFIAIRNVFTGLSDICFYLLVYSNKQYYNSQLE